MSKSGFASSTVRGEAKEPHHRRGLILQLYTDFIYSVGSESERQMRSEVVETVKSYLNLVGTPAKFITDDFLDFFSSCIEAQDESMRSRDLGGLIGAFCLLEDFALRLVAEPWRPEFRLLRLYNNLFVNGILPHVANAPKIFHCLGYEPHSSQRQTLILPSSKVVDVKAVSAVACDLLIAASELDFIKRVFIDLEAKGLTFPGDAGDHVPRPVFLRDIWEERKANIGSVEACTEHISKRGFCSSSSSSSSREKSTFRSSSSSPAPHCDSSVTGPLPRLPGGTHLGGKQQQQQQQQCATTSASSNSLPSTNHDTQRRPFGVPSAVPLFHQPRGAGVAQIGASGVSLGGIGDGNNAVTLGDSVGLSNSLSHRADGVGGGGGGGGVTSGNDNQRFIPSSPSSYGTEGYASSSRNGVSLPAPDSNAVHRRSFYDNEDYGPELHAAADVAGVHASLITRQKQQQQQQQQRQLQQQRQKQNATFPDSNPPKLTNHVLHPSLTSRADVPSSPSPEGGMGGGGGGVNVGSRGKTVEIPIQIIPSSNDHHHHEKKPKAFSTTKLTAVGPPNASAAPAVSSSHYRVPPSGVATLNSHHQQTPQYPYHPQQQQQQPRQHRASPAASPHAAAKQSHQHSRATTTTTTTTTSCADCRASGNGNLSETDDDDDDEEEEENVDAGLGEGKFQRHSPTRDSYRNAIHSQQLALGGGAESADRDGSGGGVGKKDLIEKLADLNVRDFAISQGIPAPPSSVSASRAKSFSAKTCESSSSKLLQPQQTPPLNSSTKQQQQQQHQRQSSLGRTAFSLKKPKSSSKSVVTSSSSADARNKMTASMNGSGGGVEWTCASCTFVNCKSMNVCEMCDKSRKGAPAGRGNLISGGHQCPQCTLVNDKGVMTCNACGQDLLGCPTYI